MSAKNEARIEAPPSPPSGTNLLDATYFRRERLPLPRRKLPSGFDLLAATHFPGLCRAEERR